MLKYRDIVRILLHGLSVAFIAWVSYRLLLITGYLLPFVSFQVEVVSFIPIFIGVILTFTVSDIIGRIYFPYQRTRLEVEAQFFAEQVKLRVQIALTKDEEEKKALEQQSLDLQKEHVSFLTSDLLKDGDVIVSDWREVLIVARQRLVNEEQRLLISNKLNLEFAIFMAFVGVALPLYYIFFVSELRANEGLETFFTTYGPILSVVFVFEIVALFFLRLYGQTERKIEKNKNELTNIELRLTAGLMLCDKENKANLTSLADDLAKEERNFVLGKNESSAILDTDKLLELLSKIPKIGN